MRVEGKWFDVEILGALYNKALNDRFVFFVVLTSMKSSVKPRMQTRISKKALCMDYLRVFQHP